MRKVIIKVIRKVYKITKTNKFLYFYFLYMEKDILYFYFLYMEKDIFCKNVANRDLFGKKAFHLLRIFESNFSAKQKAVDRHI